MAHSKLSRYVSRHTHSAIRSVRLSTALATLLALAAVAAPRAAAISDGEALAQFPEGGSEGSGANQLREPGGLVVDPVSGHVFVAEREGANRISEFTPWGGFVKAFGWDVAPGAVNEQQEIRVRAASGQFKLSFGASTTPDLPFDATEAEVQAALNALPSIGAGGVSVEERTGNPAGTTPYIYVVAFKEGGLAGTNVAQIVASNGTTPPGGGVPTTSLLVRTRADGTPGGTGLESCTSESGCKAGLAGEGAGEFSLPWGLAVDGAGNVYVKEVGNKRVQKFDSAGRFVWMAGGEVDKTTSANLCTKASGDVCGVGTVGSGNGQFGIGFNGGIALGNSGALYGADKDRIQRFNEAGEFQAVIPVPGEGVEEIAFDPVGGNLYATLLKKFNVRKLDPVSGAQVKEIEGSGSGAVATDSSGRLFSILQQRKVLVFNAAGEPDKENPSCCEGGLLPPPNPTKERFALVGLATNPLGTLYVTSIAPGVDSFIRAFGPPPVSFESPPKVPPEISTEFATSVLRDGATIAAEINPHFWTDTRFYVQYGTGKCSEGGCEEEEPTAPGEILTPKVFGSPVKSAPVFLEGLNPATTYHYRFVAQSSGGGPVFGEEQAFTTYPAPAPRPVCPNDVFRSGASARLPDCRAYEMVSPVDKNNGDIKSLVDFLEFRTDLSQSATDGDKFTYSSARAFANPKAAPYTNQYIATREDGVGWTSEAIAVPQGPAATFNLENQYTAFSADLCQGWLIVAAEPPLPPPGTEAYRNIYRRDGCGGGGYEALIGVKPPTLVPGEFIPELQGVSADGKEAVFRAEDKLTENATSGVFQAYYASKGGLELVCILPNGTPYAGNCTAGTAKYGTSPDELNRTADVKNAISEDGSRVYWTASEVPPADKPTGPGKVYLRVNPGQPQSAISGGACVEPDKACTLKVSETKSSKASRFVAASSDGSRALFQVTDGPAEGKLFLFELGGATTELAGKVTGLVGAGEDLSHIYFVSEEALPGTAGATADKPNLYLSHEGTKDFIATLGEDDVRIGGGLSNTLANPVYHAARASADGSSLAFISTGSPTGYDNTDLITGNADSEVYLYEAGSAGPVCVSCNPGGARPAGRVVKGIAHGNDLATAGSIPAADYQLYLNRALSDDGSRLFFNSYDALLPRDTNGKEDVYEWEKASGAKECEEKGAGLYAPSAAGCISLISSGESPQDSEFLDASSLGDDVFFTTNASLLPQDPGLIDVYDARAGGGLPPPPPPPEPCEGETCQSASAPPNDPTPASASTRGPGNATQKPKPRCAKGKARRKGRCVAKKHKRAERRHDRRGASR
jgi:NHL repeat